MGVFGSTLYETRTAKEVDSLISKYRLQWPPYLDYLKGLKADDIQISVERSDIEREKYFLSAVWNGRTSIAVYALKEPLVFDVNCVDLHGRTALHLAAIKGHHRMIVNFLKINTIDLNLQDYYGWTCLMYACLYGRSVTVKSLLTAGADSNVQDDFGNTALMIASTSPIVYILEMCTYHDLIIRRQEKKYFKMIEKVENKIKLEFNSNSFYRWWNKRKIEEHQAAIVNFGLHANFIHKQHNREICVNLLESMIYKTTTRKTLQNMTGVDTNICDIDRRTALHRAAMMGYLLAVSVLCEAQANLEVQDNEGYSPLSLAVQNNHSIVVAFLLEQMADPNAADIYFATPLNYGIKSGNAASIGHLLNNRADLNVIDCYGQTPLFIAVEMKNQNIVEKLLTSGNCKMDFIDHRGWTIMTQAVHHGMVGSFTYIFNIARNVKPEARKMIARAKDPQGRTALHHAILLGDFEACELFIELEPDIQIQDCNGNTPFHLAAQSNQLQIVQFLLPYVKEIDMRNDFGETPLILAAHGGSVSIVLFLLQMSNEQIADSHAVDSVGRNILMHACISTSLDLVNLLLLNQSGDNKDFSFKKIRINDTDHNQQSGLMYAAENGAWSVIPSLVLAKADIALRDKDGCTALHYAAMEGEHLCCSALMDIAADIDAQDKTGNAALHHVAERNESRTCHILCDRGACTKLKNYAGETPLDISTVTKNSKIKEILCQRIREEENLLGLNSYFPEMCKVPAEGTFNVTIIGATGLRMSGKIEMNPYIVADFKTNQHSNREVYISSCSVTAKPDATWNHTFTFHSEYLEAEQAIIVISVLRAPMMNELDAQPLILTETEQTHTSSKSKWEVPKRDTLINTDFDKSMEHGRKHKILSSIEKAEIDRAKQEQNSYWNSYRIASAGNTNINIPPVPASHLPFGFCIFSFRQLREAVWSSQISHQKALLRGGCGCSARLIYEVDFRPRLWNAKDQIDSKKLVSERCHTPREIEDPNDVIKKTRLG